MLIKYKDAAYNNKIEDLRNNGYTVNFVDFDYDDFVMEEGNPVPFIELQLPNGGKSYNDYSAIVAWSDYLENEDNPDVPTDFDRTHSGMPVPSSFTVQDGDTPVNCYYVIEDTATEGVVRFSRIITSQGPFSNEDFSDFVGNLCGLMFIEGDECTLNPDVSLVVPNIEAIFSQVNATETFQLDLTTKTRLLSLGDDEEVLGPRFYSFTKQPTLIIEDLTDVPAKDCICNNGNCSICHDSIFSCTALKMIGFSSIKDIETLEKSNIDLLRFIAQNNNLVFEKNVTEARPGCLYLRENVIYPIASSLSLKSDIHICGNGSTIMAYAMETNANNTLASVPMSIISNSPDNGPVLNVTIENLTFRGRFDNTAYGVEDQCIKTYCDDSIIKNLTFEKVKFRGFIFTVHNNRYGNAEPDGSSNWLFNNCDFSNSATPVMLSWISGVTFTNCHFDDSLGDTEGEHCIYIAKGSRYITVDNCLLENAVGAGIVNSDASGLVESHLMHHNVFTNLQIRNCNIGIIIGCPSQDILIENVFVTNVSRALMLQNCKNVTVNNFNASGSFYYNYIRKGTEGEHMIVNGATEWCALLLLGYVEAKISNSFFSTGGLLFYSAKSYFSLASLGRKIPSTLEFDNCVFSTTFSEYKPGSVSGIFYQPDCCLGVSTSAENGLTEYYHYNVLFNNCQFFMNSENNERSMIALKGYDGNDSEKSVYKFTDCLVAYRDGNGTPEDNHPEKADSMPDGFFIYPDKGTWVEIEDCVFYVNKANATNSSECGFVMNKYLYMDEIESDKERCLIKSYSKYHLFT